MISFVRGEVAQISLASAVIDVNGVGMLVYTTPKTLAPLRLGQEAKISTAMIVREDSMTLYGFGSEAERETFETLLTVSGIGPRLALAVLAVLDPDDIAIAVENEDGKALTKVPGIGPKVAARMVLELSGKLVHSGSVGQQSAIQPSAAWKPQVVAAMASLGWSEKDAEASVDKTVADQPELAARGNVAEILRSTLRWLGQDHSRIASGARS